MPEDIATISAPRKVWRFKLSGGEKVWEIPLIGSLNVEQAMRFRGLGKSAGNEDAMLSAAVGLFESICPGLVSALTVDQLGEVMRGWQEASGMTLGESSASSAS